MALEIQWSKRADKKFDLIIEYLLDEWSERVTKSFVRKAYDLIDVLAEFPEIGTIEFKEKGIRCFTIVKQINIFYRVKGKKIIILDFFDNRQTPQKKRF
jgi:plasmid stabilization system protein ParE